MRRGFLRFQARARGVLARNLLRSWLRAKVLGSMGMMGIRYTRRCSPVFSPKKGGSLCKNVFPPIHIYINI